MAKKKRLKQQKKDNAQKRVVPKSNLSHAKKSKSKQNSPIGNYIENTPSLKAAIGAAPTAKDVAVDALKGTNKYVTGKAHRFAHNKLAEHEADNAGIAAFHKVEDGAEKVVKAAAKSGIKTVKEAISEHNLKKVDIINLKAKYGDNLTIKQLVDKANQDIFNPRSVSANAPVLRSSKLKHASPVQASVLSLGSTAAVKEGATSLGNLAKGGKNVLKFASNNVSCSLQTKYREAIKENTSIEAMSAGIDVAKVPTRYVMKKTGKVVYSAASKSAPARAWVAARQRARSFLARQQMKFLSKHKGVAQARGAVMKTKAIIKSLFKELVTKAKPIIVIFAFVFLLVLLFQITIAPLFAAFKAGSEQIIMSTYPTDNATITSSTEQWRELEGALLQEIDDIEINHPGYDEYVYDIDPMEHDAFQLMAFLSAMNIDFTHPDVAAQIQSLFSQQNPLELIETTETRTDSHGDDYTYKILTVRLRPKPFDDIAFPILEAAGVKEMYDLYMESGGGRQMFGNPFLVDWRSYVTYSFGAVGSPTGTGYTVHDGLDIGLSEGTPILSVQNGVVVVSEYHSLYGNYIVIRDVDGNTSLYAHCSSRQASVGEIVRKGQVIAAVGSTGNVTGAHLHIEIKVNGEKVNPIFYISYPGSEQEEDG